MALSRSRTIATLVLTAALALGFGSNAVLAPEAVAHVSVSAFTVVDGPVFMSHVDGDFTTAREFYAAQTPRARITRVLVTGGGSKLEGFVELLQERLMIPVDRAHPFEKVQAGGKDLDEEAEALLAVAIGLAIPGGVR